MNKYLFLCIIISLSLVACKKENAPAQAEFKYALGSSTDYRYATASNFYYNAADSTANLVVRFENNDTFHLLWVTKFYPEKSEYLFGQYYGVNSDIMVVNFRNNETVPPYWVVDDGIGKNGTLTITSFVDNTISGVFDFDINTMNPQTFNTAVYNFKGTFNNISVSNP